MNILIVDDQKAIVKGLKENLDWDKLGIGEVYTATSAAEAKLMLVNFDIEILMTDIEMPEEDGLSLFRWVKERYPQIVGIFLTSHADFEYAKEAIQLGGFDYILQPARNDEVETCIARAMERAKHNAHMRKLDRMGRELEEQRDAMEDLIGLRAAEERWKECGELTEKLRSFTGVNFRDCVFWTLRLQILRFDKNDGSSWNSNMLRMVFRNVLEELFEDQQALVSVGDCGNYSFMVNMAAEAGRVDLEKWKRGIESFCSFINSSMGFSIAVYPENHEVREFIPERFRALLNRSKANTARKEGIFWDDVEEEDEDASNEERIRKAEEYIRANIGRGISRADVAEHLHLNEEYFSRLFKKYTGDTYKDYEVKVRIEQAKKLLANSRISVSIISSKVGYDNFSHFSRSFKKETGMTPVEYRKMHGK